MADRARRPGRPQVELEGARERDFYKYFAPYQEHVHGQEPSETPTASADQALAAFAQLGALRINARRCLISFFDRSKQYVLAEATPSLSLHTNQPLATDDDLWLGACVLDRQAMLCERTLELAEQRAGDEGDCVIVMPDVTKDEWYMNRSPHIRITPSLRFYAGMAVRSPEGYAIGTYSIFDDEPRDGLSEEETTFLKDIGKVVMSHLEMVRSKEEHARNSKMVVGLGAFVEGRDEIEGSGDSAPGQNVSAHLESPIDDGAELLSREHELSLDLPPTKRVKRRLRSDAGSSRASSGISTPTPIGSNSLRTAPSTVDLQAQMLSTNVKSTFYRAANIIRQACDVNGVAFFDASVGSFGGLVENGNEPPLSADINYPERHSYFESKESSVLAYSAEDDERQKPPNISLSEYHLHALLKKYPQGKIFNADPDEQHLTETHPRSPGQPENFGEQVEPMEDQQFDENSREALRRDREADIRMLKDIFPNARSIAFMPLWDDHRGRWFAGGLIWTNLPVRLLHKDSELSFFRAFGMSIMAEVARLDTAMADQAKTNLLNSISHELRSPLHGMLGGIECLEQGKLDTFQESLVGTIEACGRTLLDTINHLLDFAKINNFTQTTSKRQAKQQSKTGDWTSKNVSQMLNLNVDTHLPTITEEALETVFAGYESFATPSTRKSAVRNSQITGQLCHLAEANGVRIFVEIQACREGDWFLQTEAGAWRRLVMNLVGNATKYTKQGHVSVRLNHQDLGPDKKGRKSTRVTFTVTDTGKGISKEYLDNRLFKPFAQEDPLHPGTGLGLSIVHQIVTNMGGEITVNSVVGKGTEIQVQAVMLNSTSPMELVEQDTTLADAAHRFGGSKAVYVDTDGAAKVDGTVSKEASYSEEGHGTSFLPALRKLLQGWFGTDIRTVNRVRDFGDADIVITTIAGLTGLEAASQALRVPVLVLCENHSIAQQAFEVSATLQQSVAIEFIAQPFGPRKLARALMICSERLSTLKPKKQDPLTSEDEVKSENGNGNGNGNVFEVILQRNTELQVRPISPEQGGKKDPAPKASTGKESMEPTDSEKHDNTKKSLRLLLVDDNKINLQLLVRFCAAQKLDYVTAEDGVEAVAAFAEHAADQETQFDFICMDISMPRMDGLEATRRIRTFERANGVSSTKVIALTGLASAEAQQEAFSSGVDLFLTKPVRLKELGEILKGKTPS